MPPMLLIGLLQLALKIHSFTQMEFTDYLTTTGGVDLERSFHYYSTLAQTPGPLEIRQGGVGDGWQHTRQVLSQLLARFHLHLLLHLVLSEIYLQFMRNLHQSFLWRK
jgi:hypothetical protein